MPKRATLASHPGFTLIEALVAISVISVLLTLLLPAVQTVRESARRSQCRQHLKQFGIALQQYSDTHSVYPRMCLESRSASGSQTTATGWAGFSVHAVLLPFLDQNALYQQLDFNRVYRDEPNQTKKNARVSTFLCPSEIRERTIGGPGNSYVVSGGPSLIMISASSKLATIGGNSTPIHEKDQVGMFNMRKWIRIRDMRDGVSNIIAASEGILGDGEATKYTLGDLVRGTSFPGGMPNTFASQSQLDAYGSLCHANSASHYGHVHREWINGMPGQTAFSTLNAPNSTNPDCHENKANGWYDSRGVWTSRSYHSGCVNVLLADGSTRTMADSIDLTTWQRLGAINDGFTTPKF
ncbi:DUF1559 domain-containing protein [Planctomicrobium sp. SH668]|uniref:DUF1559 domain-containing protein n=1 Tax=Planctomicrobium sp. SH668 TaxID=3448126 RepID=UPI003F5C2F50